MLPGTLITFKSELSGDVQTVTCIVIHARNSHFESKYFKSKWVDSSNRPTWVDVLHSDSSSSPSIMTSWALVETIQILQRKEGWIVIPPQESEQ